MDSLSRPQTSAVIQSHGQKNPNPKIYSAYQTGKTNEEQQIRSGLQSRHRPKTVPSKLTNKTRLKDASRIHRPAEERRTGSFNTPGQNETQVRHTRVIQDQTGRSRKGGTEPRQKSEKTMTEQQLTDKYTKVQLLA